VNSDEIAQLNEALPDGTKVCYSYIDGETHKRRIGEVTDLGPDELEKALHRLGFLAVKVWLE
jgi:hypothetical protein